MTRSSSGDTSNIHPYVAAEIKKSGMDDWTTSIIKRDKKDGKIIVIIKKVKL